MNSCVTRFATSCVRAVVGCPPGTSSRRTTIPTVCALAAVGLFAVLSGAGQGHAQDALTYVKKATRDETRQASLEASGAIRWPITWQIIGPFDNAEGRGLDTVFPPEQEIKLDAQYEGRGEPARWHGVNLRDGLRVSLAHFKTSDDAVCYLYRRVDAPARCAWPSRSAARTRSSVGSMDSPWCSPAPVRAGHRAGHRHARLARRGQ